MSKQQPNFSLEELDAQEARLLKPIPPGTRFGRLTVWAFDHTDAYRQAHWYCRCDCGRHVVVNGADLRAGHTRSCGCLMREWRVKGPVPVGTRYGRLVVVAEADRGARGARRYTCRCDCGSDVEVAGSALRRATGGTISCGCYQRERASTQGGLTKHPLYMTWRNMRSRCENPDNGSYGTYGGAGIKVCERWSGALEHGFVNWLEDMGPKPTPQHSLGRFGDVGDYEPGNCAWQTMSEQKAEAKKKRASSVRSPTQVR